MEREERANNLTNSWMGNNLTHKDFQEVVKKLGIKVEKEESPEMNKEEVNKEWARLANFMSKRK